MTLSNDREPSSSRVDCVRCRDSVATWREAVMDRNLKIGEDGTIDRSQPGICFTLLEKEVLFYTRLGVPRKENVLCTIRRFNFSLFNNQFHIKTVLLPISSPLYVHATLHQNMIVLTIDGHPLYFASRGIRLAFSTKKFIAFPSVD
jgi:hypothetical protein